MLVKEENEGPLYQIILKLFIIMYWGKLTLTLQIFGLATYQLLKY